jgi:hypothetical protein
MDQEKEKTWKWRENVSERVKGDIEMETVQCEGKRSKDRELTVKRNN